jgi:hypothetical protein
MSSLVSTGSANGETYTRIPRRKRMIEGTRTHIMGRAALLAALGMATAQVWLGLAPAQAASTSPAAVVAEQRLDAGGEAEGRVSEVTRDTDGTTVVWLADGTRLTVPAEAMRGAEPVRRGAEIQAQYRETGGDKVVIRLHVMPEIQAP